MTITKYPKYNIYIETDDDKIEKYATFDNKGGEGLSDAYCYFPDHLEKSLSQEDRVCRTIYKIEGSDGGDYFNTNPKVYTYEQPLNVLVALDVLLEDIAPNISFIQYKKMKREVPIKQETIEKRHLYEYGYYDIYKVIEVNFDDIKKFLVDNNIEHNFDNLNVEKIKPKQKRKPKTTIWPVQ